MSLLRATSETRVLHCREKNLTLGGATLLVGILNVTDDSFSDGGQFNTVATAVAQAEKLVAEGAAMIDIGGQSTRPGFQEISAAEEIARVVPVIAELVKRIAVPLSIDTYKPAVAQAALEAGAHILNDVYGLQRNGELARLAARFQSPVIVMHQEDSFRDAAGDPIEKLRDYFSRSVGIAMEAGVPEESIILDPGIGFGKTHQQNLEIMARLGELKTMGHPLLLGASRKSVIGNVLGLGVEDRLEGTLATTVLWVWQGVDFVRVHDVQANARAAKMAAAIKNSA